MSTPAVSGDIDALWLEMTKIYGHKWLSAFGADPRIGAGDTWEIGLAGLTRREIADGIKACIACADPWPPTLPEFRGMCLSIPSFAAVRLDSGSPRHPFTVLVWRFVDNYAHRQSSMERADKLLRDGYELAREHVMRGGDLPAPPSGELRHSRPRPGRKTPEVAMEAIAKIKAMLSGSLSGEIASAVPNGSTLLKNVNNC